MNSKFTVNGTSETYASHHIRLLYQLTCQFILLNKMAPLPTYMDLCGAPHKFMIQPDGYC